MLEGNSVRLRGLRKEDIELDYRFLNDSDNVLFKRSGIPYPITLEDQRKWFEKENKLKDDYTFGIETLEGEHYIGNCGLDKIDWKNAVAFVWIYIGHKDYRGKGYGTDAMGVLIDFIFNQIPINKIQLEVFSFNERAIKSYKKNHFIEEGRIRSRIFRNGEYHDAVIMGILRDEWYSRVRNQ